MLTFAHYRYQIPDYHNWDCNGFTYQFSSGWYIMDDYGNAVMSYVCYAGD